MSGSIIKRLGPGLLFAGAAIGVSHLVQSTRAGADFGYGLLWALVLVNIFKYPFFQYGPRYAMATGESLLDGYAKLGKSALVIYFILTFATMFTIQTAVTIVTAGLAAYLFGITTNLVVWCWVITLICFLLLLIGRYKLLDHLMKAIILLLTLSTLIAVVLASGKADEALTFQQIFPASSIEIIFLISFMGWMPAPLDISIWHSLWAIEKKKQETDFTVKSALFDFNIGYVTTLFLGIGFVALGALVMFKSGESFADSGLKFAAQLIHLYTDSLGNWASIIIGIAAFTTMFSTTLTTLDASPRAMARSSQLLFPKRMKQPYILWIIILIVGTMVIFTFFLTEMGLLIKIATILSFVTAPFYAILNFKLITSKHTPPSWHPSIGMRVLSVAGMLFLLGFSIWYLTVL